MGSSSRLIGVLWIFALLAVAAVFLPVVYLVVRALGAGGAFWEQLLQPQTAIILWRTCVLVVLVTAVAGALGVPLAWLTVRTDLPGRRGWGILTALPLVIPSYVGALVVVAALGPRGIVQQWLEGPLGIERLPEIYGLPGAVLTLGVLTYPYVLLNVRAALSGMDPSLEEAARTLGCGPWRSFFRVVFPQLAPSLAAGCLLVALYTLSDFGAVSLLRYTTFTQAIYVQYLAAFDRELAAGWSLVLVVLTLGILWVDARVRGRARYYSTGSSSARPPHVVALGYWRWPALVFCSAVVAIGSLMPLAILTHWLIRGLLAGEPIMFLGAAAWNSFSTAALATLLCLAAALPIAVLSVRHPGRWSSLLERSSYLGFALPGVVVALGLVFFAIRFRPPGFSFPPLYQTLPLLLLAYMILFLPKAVGTSRSALLQIKPSLEEAARSLGRRPLQVLWQITLPLLRSGFAAGAGLVFLTALKELPATLILGPTGFHTLATRVWSATDEGFYARAAAAALLLVVISAVPMAILLGQGPGRRKRNQPVPTDWGQESLKNVN